MRDFKFKGEENGNMKGRKLKRFKENSVDWPQCGMTAENLYNNEKLWIIVDCEMICTKGFIVFLREWLACNRVSENKKSIFVPKFEYDKIPANIQNALQSIICEKALIIYRNEAMGYEDIFVEEEKRYVIFLTKSLDRAKYVKNIAYRKRISLRFYMMDNEGRLTYFEKERVETHFLNQDVPEEEKFRVMKEITACHLSTKIPKSQVRKGISVYDDEGKEIVLLQEVMSNSTSITYKTNIPDIFAKIYEVHMLKTTYFEDKIHLMLQKKLEYPGIEWPISTLHNSEGDFVGTLVPASEGIPLMQSILGEEQLRKNFPEWNKVDLCDLTINILEHIIFLQERNIFFGCLNPQSIFIKDKKNVYFVDLDCYQIEGYHCLAQNITFQPPEFQMDGIKKRLYTQQTENYEIAELVFMLLMPGKLPYAKEKNMDMAESIANMRFPFSWYGQSGAKEVDRPSGRWRFVWSHLGILKGDFYNTFMNNKEFNAPDKRKSARFWLREVRKLRKELEHPQDKESLELFPKTFKRDSKTEFFKCQYCGVEHPQFYFYRKYFNTPYRICNSCINTPSDKGFECLSAYHTGMDRKFIYSRKMAIYHQIATVQNPDWNKQRYCSECKHIRTQIYKKLQCRNCGCLFEFSFGQKEDYDRRFGINNWNLPKECPECRAKRK